MKPMQNIKTLLALLLATVLMMGGCSTAVSAQSPVYVSHGVCYQRSDQVSMGFLYLCKDGSNAEVASAVCDLIAASAQLLIETNRKIGPTSPENLFYTAGVESLPAIKILYDELGEAVAKAYIQEIWDMSTYVATYNITDPRTYPTQEFSSCVEDFGFIAQR